MSIIGAAQQQDRNRAAAAGAITYVGGATVFDSVSASTPLTLVLPPHATDDFMIVQGRCGDDLPTMTIGTGAGWTVLAENKTTAGFDMGSKVWYKKATSGAETNPVLNIDTNSQRSATVSIFRGVHTSTPFDATPNYQHTSGTDNPNPANPPITTASASACIVLLLGTTHDSVTAYGLPVSPTGLVMGATVISLHGSQAVAYKLNAGSSGTVTPTAWTNTFTDSGPEHHMYTTALKAQS